MSSPDSRAQLWFGWILTVLAVAFLLMDATVKLLDLKLATDATVQLGYRASVVVPIGVLELVLLAVYLMPRTSVLGAVLWTGYLGGAVASHLRPGDPWLSNVLFPVYVGVMLWGGLWLRDRRVRTVMPFVSSRPEARTAVESPARL